jgi:hypothetical protein
MRSVLTYLLTKSSRNMSQEAVLYINHKFIEVKTAITRYPIILNVNN